MGSLDRTALTVSAVACLALGYFELRRDRPEHIDALDVLFTLSLGAAMICAVWTLVGIATASLSRAAEHEGPEGNTPPPAPRVPPLARGGAIKTDSREDQPVVMRSSHSY